LTYTLSQLGYLRSVPKKRRYALSANVLSIAHPVLAALRERGLASEFVYDLAQRTESSACVAVLEGLNAVYIETAHFQDAGKYTDIGTHRALLDSSTGRALYVALDKAQREAILNKLRLYSPERSGILIDSARAAESDYARYGTCLTHGIVHPGWLGLAMPLSGMYGRKLALSIGLPTENIADVDLSKLRSALAATASKIERAFKSEEKTPMACLPFPADPLSIKHKNHIDAYCR